MHSKRKIPNSWRTGWKAKACTSFVLCLKVFKNHLYYLWDVRVLSIKPCLHAQLPEHNKSYRKVSLGWGHLITWKGPMMGHLNSFSASGGEIWTTIFQKFKCPGGCPGGGGACWSFDLTGTLYLRTLWHIFHLLAGSENVDQWRIYINTDIDIEAPYRLIVMEIHQFHSANNGTTSHLVKIGMLERVVVRFFGRGSLSGNRAHRTYLRPTNLLLSSRIV